MKPTVIDLFAGVGGLSLGFEMAGFEVALANEFDPSIAEAYKKNRPDTKMISGGHHEAPRRRDLRALRG
jgi:DNA (cytosine-5)-methyltransferase 1